MLNGADDKGRIRGLVKKIVHLNLETGFHIIQVAMEDTGQDVTFVGPGDRISEGDQVEAQGKWEIHPKFGRQLKATFICSLAPNTTAEIIAALNARAVRGAGAKTAEKLLAAFGDKLPEVMSEAASLSTAGIGRQQAEAVSSWWCERTHDASLRAFLSSHNIGRETQNKIMERYGAETRKRIIDDPYRLERDIRGVGFKKSDEIALSIGVARDDPRRIEAAILHGLHAAGREGHCALPMMNLSKNVAEILSINDARIRPHIVDMVQRRRLIEEDIGGAVVIYERHMHETEEEVADAIASRHLARRKAPEDLDARIAASAASLGLPPLHINQIHAVANSLLSDLSVITGGPGSGKTSCLAVLLDIYRAMEPEGRIMLCAPTGRAAQRMTESTGVEARTLHRALEWKPQQSGFSRNEENPLEADLILIDEASMLDVRLMRDVLRATPQEARLVLIGDIDQLPSVGAGRVLSDLIQSGCVAVSRLTKVFRQDADSSIPAAAAAINASRMPPFSKPSRSSDFWGVFTDDPEEAVAKIVNLSVNVARDLGFDPIKDVQVLSPGHAGPLGTINLNRRIQEAINPLTSAHASAGANALSVRLRDGGSARIGDRVIQTSNNYTLDVFNGDIGVIEDIRRAGRTKKTEAVIRFEDRSVIYDESAYNDVQLAYAISIHKSQGSEFPLTVIALSTQHYMLLRRTLLYTAITRARKLCAVIGQERAVRLALRGTDKNRITGLCRKIALRAGGMDGAVGN